MGGGGGIGNKVQLRPAKLELGLGLSLAIHQLILYPDNMAHPDKWPPGHLSLPEQMAPGQMAPGLMVSGQVLHGQSGTRHRLVHHFEVYFNFKEVFIFRSSSYLRSSSF